MLQSTENSFPIEDRLSKKSSLGWKRKEEGRKLREENYFWKSISFMATLWFLGLSIKMLFTSSPIVSCAPASYRTILSQTEFTNNTMIICFALPWRKSIDFVTWNPQWKIICPSKRLLPKSRQATNQCQDSFSFLLYFLSPSSINFGLQKKTSNVINTPTCKYIQTLMDVFLILNVWINIATVKASH